LLAGALTHLNKYRGAPTRHEAAQFLERSANVDSTKHECILLNSQETFDIEAGQQSAPFQPVDKNWLQDYMETELSTRSFPFESDERPTEGELKQYVPDGYERMEETRQQVGFESEMSVLVKLPGERCVKLSMEGGGFDIVPESEAVKANPLVKFDVDPRLLKKILKGPQYAHWNNASIGSHITYYRQPNTFERGTYYCMNFFHA